MPALKALVAEGAHPGEIVVAEGTNVPRTTPPPEEDQYGLLFPACDFGHLRIVVYLVEEQGCDPLAYGGELLPHHVAASNGHLHVLQWLITRCGVPVDAEMRRIRGATALHCAAKHGHLDVVKWLVEKGADPRRLAMCPPSPPQLASEVASEQGHAAVHAYLRRVEEAAERAEGQAATEAEAAQEGAEAAAEEAEGGLAGMRGGGRKN